VKKIVSSVGRNGKNIAIDVRVVQGLLNKHSLSGFPFPLKVDGRSGANTIKRIEAFQKSIVKMTRPDGRIDRGGKSIRLLSGVVTDACNNEIPIALSSDSVQVKYSNSISANQRIVSEYSFKVIKLALQKSGMSHAVITSTLRKPEKQAAIMYRNAKKNYSAQKRMYGSTGDLVLEVYKANSSKDKDEVIKLMAEKIKEQLKLGKRTSKHVVTESVYKNLNIIDIGVNSTRAVAGNTFNIKKFTNALRELKTAGYISKVIDETNKSNSCWHIVNINIKRYKLK